jgi:protein-tyrosine phosphatase
MIDIHTHLLPGVDDGSPSIDQSLPVLVAFQGSGVKKVVCTPHLTASKSATAPFERHATLLAELRGRAPHGIELLSGWEIMLDMPGISLDDPRLGLGGSSAILVEFPRTSLPPNATAELFRIRMSGRVPVVAHPERYRGCTVDTVAEWRRVGAVIQMDVTAILGSGPMSELCRGILAEGLCDVFASDTHVDRRSLAPVRDWLLDFGTEEHALLLTTINAERLLGNQEPLPVPPLELDRGIIAKLRTLIFGQRKLTGRRRTPRRS